MSKIVDKILSLMKGPKGNFHLGESPRNFPTMAKETNVVIIGGIATR